MNDFLPKDYEVPKSRGNYLKFNEKKTQFRIMSSPIIGWEWWVEEGDSKKPMRVKTFEEAVEQGVEPLKHFWAMIVVDRSDNKLRILEITQKSIMNPIKALTRDEDWGDPKGTKGYDIMVDKTGEGKETRYETNPKPRKKLDAAIVQHYAEGNIDLTALYRGEDPFEEKSKDESFSKEEVDEIFPTE